VICLLQATAKNLGRSRDRPLSAVGDVLADELTNEKIFSKMETGGAGLSLLDSQAWRRGRIAREKDERPAFNDLQ